MLHVVPGEERVAAVALFALSSFPVKRTSQARRARRGSLSVRPLVLQAHEKIEVFHI
ncbi:MAG TPA: hypothetical protein VG011_09945 [Steroidobacteraceae bacterium]|nr:hypothetical protein [Steroidobacteraceae bacterium]